MTKKTSRPSPEAIQDAYDTAEGHKVQAMRNLRSEGYRFDTGWMITVMGAYSPYRVKDNSPEQVLADFDDGGPYNGVPEDNEPDEEDGPDLIPGGAVEALEKGRETLEPGVYVFTCAQSNTRVHAGFLRALEALTDHRDAELHIATFTYNKSGFSEQGIKKDTKKATDTSDVWFDEPLTSFISDVSLQVAPDLVWCGELNIIPTRINPLSSFGAYTRKSSAIIPHVKMAMQSIPTMKVDPAKFLYSTGCVTQRNYIQKIAGQVADFHHVFGALLVEVGNDGVWFARQINADDSGMFYDLQTQYNPNGTWVDAPRPMAINHGDIHWNKRDKDVVDVMFEPAGVLDILYPHNQFMHDTVDFQARNHHNVKDPHFMHQMRIEGTDSVQQEFDEAGAWLVQESYRDWCQTYVVTSNHDQAIELWLRNPIGQFDVENALTWHRWNMEAYALRNDGQTPRPFMQALQDGMSKTGPTAQYLYDVKFLHEDDSLWMKNIQFGLHGHLGPNGARGAPKNLRTVGKANTGHTHSAGIVDGVYTAGVFGLMDMGYNKGLSSWSHSFILTYENGKRTIITIKDGRAWI